MREVFAAELYPARFRSDEARLRVLGRTACILADLEGRSAASSASIRSRRRPDQGLAVKARMVARRAH
jgi:hypothetical protein